MPLWRDRLWSLMEAEVFPALSSDRLFNPYRDQHPAHDESDAPAIRRANLHAALDALPRKPRVLVVAEAPGPWGCRFSGVPLVSEQQLLDPTYPVSGQPTSQRAAHGEPIKEYSGAIYWRVMEPYWGRFWTWNTVPLHPHKPNEPLTIRTPTVAEVRAWHGVLAAMVDVLRPETVAAVGRKAEGALTAIGAESIYVRHPSQGGATLFADGMRELLS